MYLKGVCIRTLGRHPPPVDVVVLKEFLGPTLKVVILHESDTPAGRKELVICLDVHVHLGIHCAAIPANSCPNVIGCLGRGL